MSRAQGLPESQKASLPVCADPVIMNVKCFTNTGIKCQIPSLTSPACNRNAQTCSVVISLPFPSSDKRRPLSHRVLGSALYPALDLHPTLFVLPPRQLKIRRVRSPAQPPALGMVTYILGELLRCRWLCSHPMLVPLTIRPEPSLTQLCPSELLSSKAPGSNLPAAAPGFLVWFCPCFSLG